jgi:glycosyltransferase involved in cell wall biosynthesis
VTLARDAATTVRAVTPGGGAWAVPHRFDIDPFPGRPRILFVGHSESTHAHAWIDLLADAQMNVRMFALPTGLPPDEWPVRTYVTAPTPRQLNRHSRERLYPAGRLARAPKRAYARLVAGDRAVEQRWLAQIIREWRPHIVHTLGIEPAGELFFDTRGTHQLDPSVRWVLQTRGGSDLALSRFDPARRPRLAEVMGAADCVLSDNPINFEIATEFGVGVDRISPIGTVPGTGGVDVDLLASFAAGQPSSRRVILWPKAYECPWSKALPVFEALTQHWHRFPDCEIHMLATVPESRMWFHAMPAAIKRACVIDDRIPRDAVLQLMGRSRVMLAPSLVDGTPNSMFEAMATGAFPILSPLDTIRPLVREGRNTLFARNLYPDEIGDALARAMSDDKLVDAAAVENRDLVRALADRATIRPKVVGLYESLAGARRSP